MNGYATEVFAEAHRQEALEEAANRRLLRGVLVSKSGTTADKGKKAFRLRRIFGLAFAVVLLAAIAAPGAAAATYNGPFGTQIETGSATCWTETIRSDHLRR